MTALPCHDLRSDVHEVLDDIWVNAVETGGYRPARVHYLSVRGRHVKKKARERVYAWLAEQMWLLPDECHVRCFTFDQCMEAICLLRGTTYAEIRAWARQREHARAFLDRMERRIAA